MPAPNAARLLGLSHALIFDETHHRANNRQADEDRHRGLVVVAEETKDVGAIVKSQAGGNGVANAAAQR